MAVSLYETRTLLPLLNIRKPPRTFLRDTFFRKVERSRSKKVDIDVMRGKRKMSAFVHSRSKAKLVEKRGYETNTFEPPYMKEKMETNAEDILEFRQAGNHIYENNMTPMQIATTIMTQQLRELQVRFIRREEWMASQLLLNGQIPIVGEGFDHIIDFKMPAANKSPAADKTGPAAWDQPGVDILKDIRAYCRQIERETGLVPDILIAGEEVVDVFLNNQGLRESLDTRRIDLGQIDPRMLPNGSSFLGTFKHPNIDVFGYNEWISDDTDTLVPLVHPKRIIIGSTRARTATHYGAIKHKKSMASVRWFPMVIEEEETGIDWLILQSGVVLAMHQSDAFISAKVIDGALAKAKKAKNNTLVKKSQSEA